MALSPSCNRALPGHTKPDGMRYPALTVASSARKSKTRIFGVLVAGVRDLGRRWRPGHGTRLTTPF